MSFGFNTTNNFSSSRMYMIVDYSFFFTKILMANFNVSSTYKRIFFWIFRFRNTMILSHRIYYPFIAMSFSVLPITVGLSGREFFFWVFSGDNTYLSLERTVTYNFLRFVRFLNAFLFFQRIRLIIEVVYEKLGIFVGDRRKFVWIFSTTKLVVID